MFLEGMSQVYQAYCTKIDLAVGLNVDAQGLRPGNMLSPNNLDCSRGTPCYESEGSVTCKIDDNSRCPVYDALFQKVREAKPRPSWVGNPPKVLEGAVE